MNGASWLLQPPFLILLFALSIRACAGPEMRSRVTENMDVAWKFYAGSSGMAGADRPFAGVPSSDHSGADRPFAGVPSSDHSGAYPPCAGVLSSDHSGAYPPCAGFTGPGVDDMYWRRVDLLHKRSIGNEVLEQWDRPCTGETLKTCNKSSTNYYYENQETNGVFRIAAAAFYKSCQRTAAGV